MQAAVLVLLAGCTNQPASQPGGGNKTVDPFKEERAKFEKLLMDLKVEDTAVRANAAKGLRRATIAWHDPKLRSQARLLLIAAMGDPDEGVRFNATEAFRFSCVDVLDGAEIVHSSVKDFGKDFNVATLCFLLRYVRPPGEAWRDYKQDHRVMGDADRSSDIWWVGKEDPTTRIAAAQSLARLGPLAKDAIPTLLAALNQEEMALRGGVNKAEGEKEHKAVAHAVTTALQKIDPDALEKERARQGEEAAARMYDSILRSEGGSLLPGRRNEKLHTLIRMYPTTKAAAKARESLKEQE
jgi:hypothetical protein